MGGDKHDLSYYFKCMIGGTLACGVTHTAIVPLDVVKCRRQVLIPEENRFSQLCTNLLETDWRPLAPQREQRVWVLLGALLSLDIHYRGSGNSVSTRCSRMCIRESLERNSQTSTEESDGRLHQEVLRWLQIACCAQWRQ